MCVKSTNGDTHLDFGVTHVLDNMQRALSSHAPLRPVNGENERGRRNSIRKTRKERNKREK